MAKKKQTGNGKSLILALLLLVVGVGVWMIFAAEPPVSVQDYGYRVVRAYPHDKTAYTQGLLYRNGVLFESTGQYGRSELRKVDLVSGGVLLKKPVDARFFAEGLAFHQGVFYQLTWREGICFQYHSDTFEELGRFTYEGEGWGLVSDGTYLIMSDGSDKLTFRDPLDFRVLKIIHVRDGEKMVTNLNELEYIDGEIWANIYNAHRVVRIDPKSGKVVGRIDFSGLPRPGERHGLEEQLNGIAYDSQGNRLFVTGKYYGYLYEVELEPKHKS